VSSQLSVDPGASRSYAARMGWRSTAHRTPRLALALVLLAAAAFVGSAQARTVAQLAHHPRGCPGSGGTTPAWSPDGKWIAWVPENVKAICFARNDGTQIHSLRLPSGVEPPVELQWPQRNLLVALGNYTIYSIAPHARPHLLPSGQKFSGTGGDSFSLDGSAGLLATGSSRILDSAGPVTLIPSGGGDPVTIGGNTAVNYEPSLSPDGQSVVFARQPSQGYPNPAGPFGLIVASTDGNQAQQIEPIGECPLWSPTGRSIAFLYRGLAIVPPAGGHTVTLAPNVGPRTCGEPQTIAWSPDGTRIAYVDATDLLSIVDVRTKTELTVSRLGYVGNLAWAPDSKRLLVSAGQSLTCPSLWRVAANGSKAKLLSRC
jgi:WD40 repeat protein